MCSLRVCVCVCVCVWVCVRVCVCENVMKWAYPYIVVNAPGSHEMGHHKYFIMSVVYFGFSVWRYCNTDHPDISIISHVCGYLTCYAAWLTVCFRCPVCPISPACNSCLWLTILAFRWLLTGNILWQSIDTPGGVRKRTWGQRHMKESSKMGVVSGLLILSVPWSVIQDHFWCVNFKRQTVWFGPNDFDVCTVTKCHCDWCSLLSLVFLLWMS